MDHIKMDHSKMAKPLREVPLLTIDQLKSQAPTVFPSSTPVYELKLVLGGDMERYIWHINGKTF